MVAARTATTVGASTLREVRWHHGPVATSPSGSSQPPSDRARELAVTTVTAACRSGRLTLDQAEERLDAVFAARTYAELYRAVAGLPHLPAPLDLSANG